MGVFRDGDLAADWSFGFFLGGASLRCEGVVCAEDAIL